MIQNAVIDAIHARRSIRQYQDQPIEDEKLEAILEAATWAPSGSNSQSWLFTAVQNKDVLKKINELAREGFQTYIPDDDYPAKHGAKANAKREDYCFYYHAPVLVITSNRPGYENAMADCSLALENMFLTAVSLGLGCCYVNQLHWLRDDSKLREYLFELGIPKEHTICSSAVFGYVGKEGIKTQRKEGTIRIIK